MAYVDMAEAVEVVKKHSIACIKSEKMSTDEITRFNAVFASIITSLRKLPTADVVEVNKYNELREDFIDFVCSGIHNPAPYCKNRCSECVDSSGWCTYRRCTGFNPDGERRTDNDL